MDELQEIMETAFPIIQKKLNYTDSVFAVWFSELNLAELTDEEAKAARQKEWKRRGLLLEDESVLQAMEHGEQPQRLCYTVKKDGSFSGDLADRDQLKLLEKYVFSILGRLVDDIASGNVEANPYTRGTSHSACAFCPYGAVCHEKTVEGKRNYKTMTAQRFWEEIGKEMTGYGG